jgi:formate-dependent nitrite reductase membrane component NrfD
MDVVTWGNPVGIIIFLNGVGAALLLLALAVRVAGGLFGLNRR